jgi:colanic acid biosynthesis glycosyl transferase WcaI
VKIVFFNRFFFPDTSATSQILSDLAFHLAAGGAHVHVVTSHVPGGDAALETIRGVTVHRVARTIAGPHGLARRALAYAGYYFGARSAARRLLEPGDIAIVKTDPPMLSAVIGPVARGRGSRVIAWIQDVFPEVAAMYGVPLMKSAVGDILRRKRNESLMRADRVVAIGPAMAQRLAAQGVAREKLSVIHNWADGDAIMPSAREGNALRNRWDVADKFVVGYSGNLGRVHEFDTLLAAAAALRDRDDIRFVIVGRGPRLAEVRERVVREGLSNVMFEPHQERASLSESLGAADVHLSVLQPRFDALVLPSKHYGIMAAGRPLVFIGDPAGESAQLVAEAQCGAVVETGKSGELAQVLLRLAADRGIREAMGRRGRAAFEEHFSLRHALREWREILADLGYKSS